ncbi:MAG TPA: ATP-binding protein [Candidatus Kryptonia bacterium]
MSDRASESAGLLDEAWLSLLTEQIPLGSLHIFDKDLRHVFNAGDELRKWGTSGQALCNRNIREVLDDKLADLMEKNLSRVLKGETVTFEGEYSGNRYLSRAVPFTNPSDGQTYIILHSLNLTELENGNGFSNQEEPVEGRGTTFRGDGNPVRKDDGVSFRPLSEKVSDFVAILDREGKHIYANPAYRSLFKDPDTLSQKTFLDLVHIDDRKKVAQFIGEDSTPGVDRRVELRLMAGDGNARYVEARAERLDNEASSHILVVSHDITESKKLEEQFLRAQRLESLGTLASGISHDLNNVLTPVILGVAALDRTLTDDRSKIILKMIESSLSRGRDIVKQVLTFARGVEGEHMVVQPRHIIHEAVTLMRATFSKSISIVEATPQTLWLISGDATRLTQLLMNLGVNARDAMPDGGTLNITAENIFVDSKHAAMHENITPGRFVLIGVQDTGTGMDPELMERIFEPFFTTKEYGKGSGLGLSIVRDIVNGHSGFIELQSEPGVGTTFKVYIPATDGETTIQADEWDGKSPYGHNELLLVVDDELSVCQITKQTLESFGYRVLTANDGAEAVAIYADQGREIALVLIDIMMPVMDGPRTIRALKRLNPRLKVIATSGLVSENHAALEGELIPDAFIAKPYTAAKFLRTIDSVLRDNKNT